MSFYPVVDSEALTTVDPPKNRRPTVVPVQPPTPALYLSLSPTPSLDRWSPKPSAQRDPVVDPAVEV